MEDKEFILESARRLERWENTSRPVADDYADMNRDELIKLIAYLRERLEEAEREREESACRISDLSARVSALTEKISGLTDMLRKSQEGQSALLKQLIEKDRLIADLQSAVKVGRKNLYGGKSQKGIKSKAKEDGRHSTPHTDVKDDFDGSPESLPENLDVDAGVNGDVQSTTTGPAVAQKVAWRT